MNVHTYIIWYCDMSRGLKPSKTLIAKVGCCFSREWFLAKITKKTIQIDPQTIPRGEDSTKQIGKLMPDSMEQVPTPETANNIEQYVFQIWFDPPLLLLTLLIHLHMTLLIHLHFASPSSSSLRGVLGFQWTCTDLRVSSVSLVSFVGFIMTDDDPIMSLLMTL